jgi:hypothetical protein
MTKAEAKDLTDALQDIERGKVEAGAAKLRLALRDAGWPAPPNLIEDRVRKPQGKER